MSAVCTGESTPRSPWQNVPFVATVVGATSLLLWIGVM
jgi:hypothetical protein